MPSNQGEPHSPAPVSFEERDGVPTWYIPARNGTATVAVVDGLVYVEAAHDFGEDQLRGLAIALQAALSRRETARVAARPGRPA